MATEFTNYIKFSNFARTVLSLGATNTDTAMSVADASLFPSIGGEQYFLCVLEDAANNREIVKVTSKAANNLTVVRGQEGTTARAWAQGDRIALRFTAGSIQARFTEITDDLTTIVDDLSERVGHIEGRVPIGEVIMWTSSVIPTGFLECNGAAMSRASYADLFGVIGETFGDGDGSTTFNLPDLRGIFVRGYDHGAGNDPDVDIRKPHDNRLPATSSVGDVLGSYQSAASHDHIHTLWGASATANGSGAWAGGQISTDQGNYYTKGLLSTADGGQWGAGGSGFGRYQFSGGTAAEARPKNVSLMFLIRYQ